MFFARTVSLLFQFATNPTFIDYLLQLEVEFVIGRDIKPETIDSVVGVLERWYDSSNLFNCKFSALCCAILNSRQARRDLGNVTLKQAYENDNDNINIKFGEEGPRRCYTETSLRE